METQARPQRCMVKVGDGNLPCGRPVVYMTAEQAQKAGRGQYSGWRHVLALDLGHHAVPMNWV